LTIFTLLFAAFTIILYSFLFLLKKELVFSAKRVSIFSLILPVFLGVISASLFITMGDLDNIIRGIAVGASIASYAISARGMTEERFILHSMDNRGIRFDEVDRVVLTEVPEKAEVKLNFFKFGLRGPLMKFHTPIDELVNFLASHLKEGTPIDVVSEKN